MKPPKYTHGFVDRHGHARFYFRRAGYKPATLPGLPWSPGFMAAYEAALKNDRPEIGASRTLPGTVSAALVAYYQHPAFTDALAKVTQQNRRAILENFRCEPGDKRLALMHVQALQAIINHKTPAMRKLRKIRHATRRALRHDWQWSCYCRPAMPEPTWCGWVHIMFVAASCQCDGKRPLCRSIFRCCLTWSRN